MNRLIGNEVRYIMEVLSDEFRASKAGLMVTRFERAFAKQFNSRWAIAHANGTATLHAALAAANLKPGDRVIVPSLTMASTSLAVYHAGCIPVWADVCEDSWCIDPRRIEELIDERTKAIITVSLYGMAPDMERILKIANRYNLLLIEDNAQCIGGSYKGKQIGTFGDAASYSFQSSKTLSCGEGGVVITNDKDYADAIRSFSSLGYKPGFSKGDIQNPRAERHHRLGWNYRMSDLQAAVALAQLEDMETHTNARKNAAHEMYPDCSWLIPQSASYEHEHAFWALALEIRDAPVTWEQFRDKFVDNGGDPFYSCWLPTYKEPVFKGWKANCPVAEELQPNIVAFKTNYDLFDEAQEQDRILQKTIEQCNKVS